MPAALADSKLEFTVRWIEALTPPATGQRTYWDVLVPSFGLRIGAGGGKAWIVQRRVKGKVRRFTIGHYPELGLSDARDAAREVRLEISKGKDPAREAERREEQEARELAATWGAACTRFLAEYVDAKMADGKTWALRERTRDEYRRVLSTKPFEDWKDRPLCDITFHRIKALIQPLVKSSGGYAANRVHAYLRCFFNWCLAERLIEANPMQGMKRPTEEVAREFFLTEADLFTLHPSLSASPTFAPILKLLLLTGQRREEVGGMQWEELENLDGAKPVWRIPPARAKNGREHIVPLVPAAVALLPAERKKTGFVFGATGETAPSGYSKCKAAVVRDLEAREVSLSCGALDAWRMHDFRRTVATHMGELGIAIDVIEGTLNHVSGKRKGIVATYNRSQLIDDRRAALQTWAMYLQRVTEKEHTLDDVEALRRECRREYFRLLAGADAGVPVPLRLVA